MAWTNITAPAVGDPTKATAFAGLVVDNLAFLYNQFLAVVGNREIILNGSFESDADADGSPDGWVIAAIGSGGSFTWDESTVAGDEKAYHGKRSAKCTSPGGAGSGGRSLTSESFFEVSEGRPYKIQFATKSSVVDVHNKVEMIFYDSTQTLISTSTVHDEAAANPTSWKIYEYVMEPPANARYAKLKFYGCVNDDTTAGSTWYDDIRIVGYIPAFERRCMFNTSGSFKWKVPVGVTWVGVICVGGGGGGGGAEAGSGAGGGGGGAMSFDIQSLTAGTSYAFSVGAGGSGGSKGAPNTNGSAGGTSSFTGSASLSAAGGSGGTRATAGGAGGAGGAASGGRVNTTGTTGATRSGTTGGDGGEQPAYGPYGLGGSSGNNGNPGPGYGGGGGGGGSAGDGGAGSNGIVLLLF